MSQQSHIEWTNSSWNPVTGCTEVSPGCDHCYAKRIAERFRGVAGSPYAQGFDLKLWPERLVLPEKWKKPRLIFVNSMSDLFHKDVPDEFIREVFHVMAVRAPHHTYQVLTKRPSRAVLMAHTLPWTPNIWFGTSVENNEYLWRVDKLMRTPAAIKFVSAEPLLGKLVNLQLSGIDWLIAGAESGPGARPMDLDWVRHLRDLCLEYPTAFFFKQDALRGRKISLPELDGVRWQQFPDTAKAVSR